MKTQDKKRLITNFASLSLLQAANYILPLLTFPYLVQVLGIDYFGLLAFATAIITYFNIIVNYGFNITAVHDIAKHRENKDKVTEIFSSIMTVKVLLMLFSFILMSTLVLSFQKFSTDWEVYFLTFGIVIGQGIFPVWLFQGLEKMKYITKINILSKLISTVLIFTLVDKASDYYMVPILISIGFIVAGIYSLYLVKKELKIDFKLQSIHQIKFYLFDGWHIFLSQLYVSLYTTTNTVLLGFLTNNTIVGYYSIAEKIVGAINGLFAPINQTLYPYLVTQYDKSEQLFFKLIKKISIVYILISISFFSLGYFFAENLIVLINGSFNNSILNIYLILLATTIFTPFGSFFTNILIILKLKLKYNSIVLRIFLINILLAPVSIITYGATGLAVVVVFLQFFVITLCLREIKKYRIINYGRD